MTATRTTTSEYGMGRVPFMHPKAAGWPVAPLLTEPVSIREHPWPKSRLNIHQGSSGTCTAASLLGIISGLPVAWSPALLRSRLQIDESWEPDPVRQLIAGLYRRLVAHDVWPDNDYEAGPITCERLEQMQFGSSVDAAMMEGVRSGLWRQVRWCHNPRELSQWVRRVDGSPGQIGITWRTEWFNPPADGIVRELGRREAGGHALKVRWHYPRKKLWLIDNSWGSGWGLNGSFYMTDELFEQVVFTERGECAVAVEGTP